MKIRRLTFLLLAFMAFSVEAISQPFNNEWINYNNTYFKFKVGKDSLYQIGQALLQQNGLGSTPVEQFRLYRNGVEVPLYTSVSSGMLPAGGYLEFWGRANDGEPDRPLYRRPEYQHVTNYNLHSDTAIYFLTVEATSPNKRYADVVNDVNGNTIPVEPYFLYKTGNRFKEQQNPGFAADLDEYVYSSSYDKGEFWSSWDINERETRSETLNNLKAVTGGPNAIINFGAFGKTVKPRRIKLSLNGTVLQDTAMNYFDDLVSTVSFPSASLASGTVTVSFTNVQPPPTPTENYTDHFVLSYYDLIYPREFDFNNSSQFYFELEARTQGYYLEIKNFNSAGSTPVLYDLETRERYVANIALAGVLRFVLKGSATQRKMVLVNPQAGFVAQVNSLTPRTFTNYANNAVQGNYLIISNPKLYNGSGGANPVEAYRLYRSSTAGGSYNSKVYDINELTDQFAFGIKGHPLAVKNFIRFARASFSQPVSKVFLIGKGVNYSEYKYVTNWDIPTYEEQPRLDELNLVPTFGYPGSDNMLASVSSTSAVAVTEIGRLSAVSATEVEDYLEKVKEYEQVQQSAPNTTAGRLWMKNILEVTGATNALLGTQLCNYMSTYKILAEDTLVGANVTEICKSISDPGGDQSSAQLIRSKFEDGMSMLTYFGHSSATTLEFSIENPETYNNHGKYPVFSVNGCYAGDLFRYNLQRFNELQTLSEKFTLTRQRGSIAFIASTHFGITSYLDVYLRAFYTKMGKTDYGASIAKLTEDALAEMLNNYGQFDFLARTHAEQINLHGDPALVMNFQQKPDYIIEEPLVLVDPSFISVADQNFLVKFRYYNMGKSTNDSVQVDVKRTRPDGTIVTIFSQKRPPFKYVDSLSFVLPIVATTDKGLNKISIVLDGVGQIDETDENNNSVIKSCYIYQDGATPIFPYNYAIVSDPAQKFFASTADPFNKTKQYVLEIDTTALFNSSLKKAVNLSSVGGVLEFTPQMSFVDSTVYYWRTAMVPNPDSPYVWGKASFLFRNIKQEGFNQSHFYQHKNSVTNHVFIDSSSRVWEFTNKQNDLFIRQATYPTASGEQADFTINPNDEGPTGAGCLYDELIFHVLDKNTFKLWPNDFSGPTGLYGSYRSVCGGGRESNFEYPINTRDWRKKAMDFLDIIPDGSYVVVRNNGNPDPAGNTYPDVWRADTAVFGSNNSLYHRLFNQGFKDIDSANRPRGWAFIFRKNSPTSFTPVSKFTVDAYDKIAFSVFCTTPQSNGTITSPVFGPAKQWHEMRWAGRSLDQPVNDVVNISIIGVMNDGTEKILRDVAMNEKRVDISDIDATVYPNLKLRMDNKDTITLTPYQLDYWRLIYDPVPEGALAPNLFFTTRDTVELGEIVNFGIAFKNVSHVAFDSLKMKLILTDHNNVPHVLPQGLLKPLISGDTIIFRYSIDTKNYPGLNTLYVEFNPDNHQPEQYHFNNFLFRNLYVRYDKTNPVLDVTFDGTHILSGDIVSARPWIQIRLKDESKFLLLKDTSLMRVRVKFPDGSVKSYRYDNDTVRFTPAMNASDNTATIDFRPSFLKTYREDGIDNYELSVNGKDASNNIAGKIDYNINFLVINKPMISNLLNYPNPFTTSTAFVFTITGSEIPNNIKIQILTVTGKVVREITGDELGPLHIGRNITEFKWDGTDQFGQRLGNGVYLYRVISMLNGKKMDKFKSERDNTDKYFTGGYGKMYLMR
ncbi:putative type IX secretion system sortase PorU2 [Flavihumibacter profundi]|uniref:putative type IX secretion system sortase PorU2 n=1 Tax=Flavihumibacter profundi TaxID=2716883 RepID=UPI001CC50708|nr:C25 family cysteine peptidase [Flavihumibacter profundi]MBZ5859154.1 C25 family cysteine peptidase [Flavihumibacter profundi]